MAHSDSYKPTPPEGGTSGALHEARLHEQAGDSSAAEIAYRRALQHDPAHLEALTGYAMLAYRTNQIEVAVDVLKQALAYHPDVALLHINRGAILQQLGRLEEAEHHLRRATHLAPDAAAAHLSLGSILRARHNLSDAAACFRQALACDATLAAAANNLGLTLHELGHLDEAHAVLKQAAEQHPDHANMAYNLGNVLYEQGQLEAAIIHYQRAVKLSPNFAEAYANLGIALRAQGTLADAVAALQQAVALAPDLPGVHTNLGIAYQQGNDPEAAATSYRHQLEQTPDDADTLYNLGTCLKSMAHLEEAEQCLRQATTLEPAHADAHMNLGNVLRAQGRVPEAIASYRQAIRLAPNHAQVHSNLLLAMNYDAILPPEAIRRAHENWAREHTPRPSLPPRRQRQDTRLRIGYVSPDFREHSVRYFIEPIFRQHNRDRFAIYGYAEIKHPDTATERLRQLADAWCSTINLSDEAVADRIRADQIDILVDLAGHTGNNRLGVFALHPAPLQITYLGYPNTTGLSSIAYRLTDAWADPLGSEAYYTEALYRLEPGFLCYQPPAESPAVAPLPALKNGRITFGSFNALPKITETVVATWATLLNRLPRARLLLKSPSFEDGATRTRYLDLFATQGIDPERIILHSFLPDIAAHLAMYHQVDIALDPFPYNGTTTTCEALWMGVPVMSLAGTSHAGRVGLSLLQQVELSFGCASSISEYLDTAIALAKDLDRLAALRAGLRERMRESPLCDAAGFTRTLEHTYKHLFQRTIQQNPIE